MKKISQEDLELLNKVNNNMNILLFELGEIEYQKIILTNKKKEIIFKTEELKKEDQQLKQLLIKKYGDNININLEKKEKPLVLPWVKTKEIIH